MRSRAHAAIAVLLLPAGSAMAQTPDIFRNSDLALGEPLLRDKCCADGHVRKVGGDGSAMGRPSGRINTPGALRGMVDYCSNELNLSLFPEEITAIAAVLQRDHYRFGSAAAAAAKAASRR
jgi:hypothetical protein